MKFLKSLKSLIKDETRKKIVEAAKILVCKFFLKVVLPGTVIATDYCTKKYFETSLFDEDLCDFRGDNFCSIREV